LTETDFVFAEIENRLALTGVTTTPLTAENSEILVARMRPWEQYSHALALETPRIRLVYDRV